MSEAKDPAIKLFGKTILVLEVTAFSGDSPGAGGACSGPVVEDTMDQDLVSSTNSSPESNTNRDGEEREVDKDALVEKSIQTKQEQDTQPLASEELSNPDARSGIGESPKTSSVDEKESGDLKTNSEEEQSETGNSQEKTLKKPDKILTCSRCNSTDTKFCYYNNYNVNQPRHFCKNCQRYWTAGGTMRNVPVGAGRRKNKNSSLYRNITVPEALQSARADGSNDGHPSLKCNGTVLIFGTDSPLCESMASVSNLADKTMQHYAQNGFHKPEDLRIAASYGGGEICDDHSYGSCITASNSKDESSKTGSHEQVMQSCMRFPPQVPCYTGAPWPQPWASAQWSPPVVPLPTFYPPGYPFPFYPTAAYWGCSVPGMWNIPWVPQSSSTNQPALSSGPYSPTLGKHSRDDENTLKPASFGQGEPRKASNPERCLWIPKTLRIDDPGEAAKSSIWATLGIKKDKADSLSGRGLFKAFQLKDDEKNNISKTSVLQANPAALSRSVNFQESS